LFIYFVYFYGGHYDNLNFTDLLINKDILNLMDNVYIKISKYINKKEIMVNPILIPFSFDKIGKISIILRIFMKNIDINIDMFDIEKLVNLIYELPLISRVGICLSDS
jgi:hypothetical protein